MSRWAAFPAQALPGHNAFQTHLQGRHQPHPQAEGHPLEQEGAAPADDHHPVGRGVLQDQGLHLGHVAPVLPIMPLPEGGADFVHFPGHPAPALACLFQVLKEPFLIHVCVAQTLGHQPADLAAAAAVLPGNRQDRHYFTPLPRNRPEN